MGALADEIAKEVSCAAAAAAAAAAVDSQQAVTDAPPPSPAVENTRVPNHRRQKIEIKNVQMIFKLIQKARQLRLISSTSRFPALFLGAKFAPSLPTQRGSVLESTLLRD